LGTFVVLSTALITSFVAYYQKESRDYNQLIPVFKQIFNTQSVVGFTQYAWLGLRISMGKVEIHFMAPSDIPQAYAIRSEKLKTRKGISTFTILL
jgi:hypothetical protein